MKNSRRWFYTIPAFVFVTAFQNCSVYKTEGRKFVEDGGAKTAKQQAGLTTSGSSLSSTPAPAGAPKPKVASNCEPYIDDATASEAMGAYSTTKLVLNESDESASCLISRSDASDSPALDYAVCSVSAQNLQLLQNPPDQTMVLDPLGPLSQGSLGFSRKSANGVTQFIFVGSSDSATEAVSCQFVFDTEQEFAAQSAEALERAASLVHAIAPNLR